MKELWIPSMLPSIKQQLDGSWKVTKAHHTHACPDDGKPHAEAKGEKLEYGERCDASGCEAACPPIDKKTGSFGRVQVVDDLRAAELLDRYPDHVKLWDDVKDLLLDENGNIDWDFDRFFGLEAAQPTRPQVTTKRKSKGTR